MSRIRNSLAVLCACAILARCFLMMVGSEAFADCFAVDPVFMQFDRREVSGLQRELAPCDAAKEKNIKEPAVTVSTNEQSRTEATSSRLAFLVTTGSVLLVAGAVVARKRLHTAKG